MYVTTTEKYRRGSSIDTRSPKLSRKSKALAKSTTALNYMRYDEAQNDDFHRLRGRL